MCAGLLVGQLSRFIGTVPTRCSLGEKGEWNLDELKIEFEELSVADAPIEASGFALEWMRPARVFAVCFGSECVTAI